jgi:hypothetical protein
MRARRSRLLLAQKWERNHLLLFKASLEFLTRGTINGTEQGTV